MTLDELTTIAVRLQAEANATEHPAAGYLSDAARNLTSAIGALTVDERRRALKVAK